MNHPGRFNLTDEKRALLDMLLAEEGVAAPPTERIPRRREDGPAPLSFAQQRLWFLDRLMPGNPFYSCDATIPILARVDADALHRAVNELAKRHGQLRASFVELDGEAVQVVAREVDVPLTRVDLAHEPVHERRREALRIATAEARRPFALTQGPLLRTTLITLGETEHMLVLTMHHIISDGWSLGVFSRELQECYAAYSTGRTPVLPELSVDYVDYAAWQRSWLSGERLEAQLDYWRKRLSRLPLLRLPTDRVRPAIPSFRGAYIPVELSRPLTQGVRRLAHQEEATPFIVLLAAYKLLLSRWADQDDVVVGSPIANRNRAELEGIVGFFVNSLVMRTSLGGDPSFRELIGRVRETALGAYNNQDLPFEMLVHQIHPERDLSRNPLFQVTFQLFNAPSAAEHGGNASAAGQVVQIERSTSKFDLRLDMWETPDGMRGQFEYATDLYDDASARTMMDQLRTIVEQAVGNPDQALSAIGLLSEEEEHRALVTWNETSEPYPRDRTIHDLFEEQVERAPRAVALGYGSVEWTYEELNRFAASVAVGLRREQVGRGERVGVLVSPSPGFVGSVLGVLKAGAAYVPLDPEYPKERLSFMLEDAGTRVVLTEGALAHRVEEAGVRVVVVDDVEPLEAGADCTGVQGSGEDLAYVMYTSGSTGRPKGVCVPHRAVNRLVLNTNYVALDATHSVANMSNVSFDASTFELWGALLNGARIVGVGRDLALSPGALRAHLRDTGVTTAFVTTALFQQIVDALPDCFASLHTLLVGGSLANPGHFRRVVEAGAPERLLHVYGPTENTTFSTFHPIVAAPPVDRPLPIGSPIANSTCFVLDAAGRPAGLGVPGELYVGGDGLATGYHGLPELTRGRFVPHPFSTDADARLYRTGDKVRRLPSGEIVFLGRNDRQTKVRGFRVELGEIETVLAGHPAVAEAVTVVREDRSDDQRIVSYVTLRKDENLPAEDAVVDHWHDLYDRMIYGGLDGDAEGEDGTFRIDGWTSSYTGRPIPSDEMREQVDGTVGRIWALGPSRMLEIGVGTGLLLFPLVGRTERYVATDFSRPALDHIASVLPQADKVRVELLERTADDFSGLEAGAFDVVVLNSVVQYFPDLDYLRRVLRGAARVLAPGGAIFLGDLRSFDHLEAFWFSVELERAAPDLPARELARRVAARIEQEQELAISPRFLLDVPSEISDVRCVQMQMKRGRADNELARFRFDAVLTVGPQSAPAAAPAAPAAPAVDIPWLDGSRMSLADVRRRLATEPPVLGLRGVPNRRLVREAEGLRYIESEESADVGALRRHLDGLDPAAVIHPEDLWALAEAGAGEGQGEGPYSVEVFWSPEGRGDRCDVLMRHRDVGAVPFPARERWGGRGRRATDPASGRFRRNIVPLLREYMQEKLPAYMVPAQYVPLGVLPLTPNGKVDFAALPAPDATLDGASRAYVAPATATEERLAGIWSQVLGVEIVGLHDDFFTELGGHSLLATQVISHVRKALNVDVPLRCLFESPTVATFAVAVSERLADAPGQDHGIRPVESGIAIDALDDAEVDALLREMM